MEYSEANAGNTRALKLRREPKMEKKGDFSNRIIRDAWLKEHGGTAVKEENVWYWVAPEPAPKTKKPKAVEEKVKKKVFNKKLF